MKGKIVKSEKDVNYELKMKLSQLMLDFSKVLIVSADTVTKKQWQNIRKALRGDSVLMVDKILDKDLMSRCIVRHAKKTGKQAYWSLLPLPVGNVGFLFTKGNLKEVVEEVAKHNVVIQSLYDGGLVFSPELLYLSEDDLVEKFTAGLSSMVTSLSLSSYTTLSAASEMFIRAYKHVLAIVIATGYTFPQSEKIKEYLKDPSRFLVAAASATLAAAVAAAPLASVKGKEKMIVDESDDVEFTN